MLHWEEEYVGKLVVGSIERVVRTRNSEESRKIRCRTMGERLGESVLEQSRTDTLQPQEVMDEPSPVANRSRMLSQCSGAQSAGPEYWRLHSRPRDGDSLTDLPKPEMRGAGAGKKRGLGETLAVPRFTPIRAAQHWWGSHPRCLIPAPADSVVDITHHPSPKASNKV